VSDEHRAAGLLSTPTINGELQDLLKQLTPEKRWWPEYADQPDEHWALENAYRRLGCAYEEHICLVDQAAWLSALTLDSLDLRVPQALIDNSMAR
jgi:hypothetical protein